MRTAIRTREQAVWAELEQRPAEPAEHWTDDALCREYDADWWYAEGSGDRRSEVARRICQGCPIKDACLEVGIATPIEHDWGTWGGTTKHERRAIRKERGLPTGASQRQDGRDRLAKKVRGLISEGHSDAEVAVRLGIAERTVARVRKDYGIKPHPLNAMHGPGVTA